MAVVAGQPPHAGPFTCPHGRGCRKPQLFFSYCDAKLRVVVALCKKEGEMPSDNGDCCLRKIITIQDLSALVVLSDRQLQRMVRDGVIPLAKNKHGQPMRGKFVLGEAVPHFVENLRDSLVTADPSKVAFNHDRARKMKIEADSAQLDFEEKKGAMVRVSDIEFEIHQT